MPLPGNISPLCIQNELILARFARRVSDKPRTQPFGNTLCENIARKDPFSRPRYPNHAKRAYLAILSSQTALMPEPDCPNPSIPGGTVPPTPMALPPGIALPMPHGNPAPGRLHRQCRAQTKSVANDIGDSSQPNSQRTTLAAPASDASRANGIATHSLPLQKQKGDPVGSPFNSGTDQKNQLKVIVDDPYLYRSSFSFAAS